MSNWLKLEVEVCLIISLRLIGGVGLDWIMGQLYILGQSMLSEPIGVNWANWVQSR